MALSFSIACLRLCVGGTLYHWRYHERSFELFFHSAESFLGHVADLMYSRRSVFKFVDRLLNISSTRFLTDPRNVD